MKKHLLVVPLLAFFCSAQAQLNNVYLYSCIRPADSLTKELQLNFVNFNYFRNYEYSNNFHDGYTLFGTQLKPQLAYYPDPNLSIIAGAYFRKDFGNERGLYDAKPLFNVKYSKNNLTLAFGSIEGAIQHNYIEPLYDFEHKITMPIEYGIQFMVDKVRFQADSWVAWQKMIYKGDAKKEEIVGGFVTDIILFKDQAWQLRIPAQMLVYHQGGQIDALKNIPMSTLFNGASGFTLSKSIGYGVKRLYTNNQVVVYKDFSRTKVRAYQGGFGLWLNAGIDARWGNFSISYWQGNHFMSIKGMPLYQSVSDNLYKKDYTESKRQMLMFRYQYLKELLPSLYLDVRFEPHIDLRNSSSNLQFNHSFFLTYKESLRLLKLKK
jgi:hypothetical protein